MFHGAITLYEGVIEQTNFDSYPVLRINGMPRVEVHIVPSAAPPTGAGQIAVATVAPAVSNALYAAAGRRERALPFNRI